jgi:hypothetical protein
MKMVRSDLAASGVIDTIVLGRPASTDDVARRVFDAALFDSGRPVLLLTPNVPDDLLRHA